MTVNYNSWASDLGPTGEFIRTRDWSKSPLGPFPRWPAPLHIAVSNALDSPVATVVLWGPDLIQIYNEQYRLILEERHPVAMGQATRECWPEVWDFNAPVYHKVMTTGVTVHFEDQKFLLAPRDGVSVFYFTVTYSPLRDHTRAILGVIVRVVEVTEQVALKSEREKLETMSAVAAERQSFNLRLADALRSVAEPKDIIASASEILGTQLGASRVVYCEVVCALQALTQYDLAEEWTVAMERSWSTRSKDQGSRFC